MNKIIAIILAVAVFFLLAAAPIQDYREISEDILHPFASSIVEQQGFARAYLDDSLQQLYDTIKASLLHGEREILVRRFSYNEDGIVKVLWCIQEDSPEIFWVDWTSWEYVEHSSGFIIRPSYLASVETTAGMQAGLDEAVETFLTAAAASGAESEYEKVLFLHDYLIDNVTYLENGPADIHTAYGALVERAAVCDGYAHAFQLLAMRMGLECYYVEGSTVGSRTDVGHAWNIIKIDDAYYQIDVTWNDIETITGGDWNGDGIKSYTYFLLSSDQMHRDHIDSSPFALPECEAYNYFQHIGLSGSALRDIRDAVISVSVGRLRDGVNYIEFQLTDADALTGFQTNRDSAASDLLTDINEALSNAGSSIRIGSGFSNVSVEHGVVTLFFNLD